MVKSDHYNSLALDISNRCNLSCSYCFESKTKENLSINDENIINKINFFFSNMFNYNSKFIHIHFGRREPFLNFKLMVSCINHISNYAILNNKKVIIHITSNGTVLNKDIIIFLKKYNVDLRLSYDGDWEESSLYRLQDKESFYKIRNNINMLIQNDIKFTINSVYSPSISIKKVITHLKSIGIKSVDFFPMWIPDINVNDTFSKNNIDRFNSEMTDIYENFTNINLAKEYPRISIVSNYLRFQFGFTKNDYSCQAGRTYVGISSAGEFVPCLKALNLSKEERFKLQNFVRPIAEINKCKSCEILSICNGVCQVDISNQNSFTKSFDFYCHYKKTFWKLTNNLYNKFKVDNPEYLINLVYRS